MTKTLLEFLSQNEEIILKAQEVFEDYSCVAFYQGCIGILSCEHTFKDVSFKQKTHDREIFVTKLHPREIGVISEIPLGLRSNGQVAGYPIAEDSTEEKHRKAYEEAIEQFERVGLSH